MNDYLVKFMSIIRRYFDPIRSGWYHKKIKQTTVEITPLTIYLRLDDPYSYLAVQLLKDIDDILVEQMKPLQIVFSQTSSSPPSNMTLTEWQHYTLNDAKILAKQHRFSYDDIPEIPSREAIEKVQLILEHSDLEGQEFFYLLEDVFHILWQQQSGKLDVLYQKAKQQLDHRQTAFRYTDQPILTAYFSFADREYHAIDGLLRLTRRLQQSHLLTAPPIFLINHIEWREHLIQGVEEIADIQALEPELDLYIALEDPMSWLILAYLKEQSLEYYNIKLNIYPIHYQAKDEFDWSLAYRVSKRTRVDFAPFCRPTETATLQMAKLFYSVPEEKRVMALFYILQAVWTQGKDLSYAKHFKQVQESLGLTELVTQDVYSLLNANTQAYKATHQPDLPVLKLRIDHEEYVFNSLYRIWLIESIFSNVLERRYKIEQEESEHTT